MEYAEGKPGEMVRICPACQQVSVIGHGWRDRQAHDANHTQIRIHRGICKLCGRTLTMLLDWLVPGGHYSSPPANKPNIWPPGKKVPWRMCPRLRRRGALCGPLHGRALIPTPTAKSVAEHQYGKMGTTAHLVCLGLESV